MAIRIAPLRRPSMHLADPEKLLTRVRVNDRGVAQPGRALPSGGRGRRFESSHPDQLVTVNSDLTVIVCCSKHPCARAAEHPNKPLAAAH